MKNNGQNSLDEVTASISVSTINRILQKHRQTCPSAYTYDTQIKSLKLDVNITIVEDVILDFSNAKQDITALLIKSSVPRIRAVFKELDGHILDTVDLSCAATISLKLPNSPSLPISMESKDLDIEIIQAEYVETYDAYTGPYDVNELIKYIGQVLGSDFVSNYFSSLVLPNPAQAVAGIPIKVNILSSDGKYLCVGVDVDTEISFQETTLNHNAYTRHAYAAMVSGVSTKPVFNPEIGRNEQQIDFRNAKNLLSSDWLQLPEISKDSQNQSDLVIWISEGAMDRVVHKILDFTRSEPLHDNDDWHISGEYGYAVNNAHASLPGKGCVVKTDFTSWIKGKLVGRKWWNFIFSSDFNGGAKVEPSLSANCSFVQNGDGTELRVRPVAFPFVILPWILFDNPIDFIVGLFLNTFILLFGNLASTTIIPLLSLFLNIRLVTLPDQLNVLVPIKPRLTGISVQSGSINVTGSISM